MCEGVADCGDDRDDNTFDDFDGFGDFDHCADGSHGVYCCRAACASGQSRAFS